MRFNLDGRLESFRFFERLRFPLMVLMALIDVVSGRTFLKWEKPSR